jgi:hypothetical protein
VSSRRLRRCGRWSRICRRRSDAPETGELTRCPPPLARRLSCRHDSPRGESSPSPVSSLRRGNSPPLYQASHRPRQRLRAQRQACEAAEAAQEAQGPRAAASVRSQGTRPPQSRKAVAPTRHARPGAGGSRRADSRAVGNAIPPASTLAAVRWRSTSRSSPRPAAIRMRCPWCCGALVRSSPLSQAAGRAVLAHRHNLDGTRGLS